MSCEGREEEIKTIRAFLTAFGTDTDHDEPKPILYISGSPGTGKTALVNSVLSSLKHSPDFTMQTIFLNCMAFQSVDALWSKLEEELLKTGKRGKRTTSKRMDARDVIADFLERNEESKWYSISV